MDEQLQTLNALALNRIRDGWSIMLEPHQGLVRCIVTHPNVEMEERVAIGETPLGALARALFIEPEGE
jgi:hypothetical protein